MTTSKEYLKIALGGNMNVSTLTPLAIEEIMTDFANKHYAEQLALCSVSKRWLFWFESEGKEGYTFEIEAEDSNDAYDKAYDSYGPQVAGMMYQII